MNKFGNGHHLQLIDGSGYVFRAFHMAERSLPARNRFRSDRTPIGAIHYFCNMLFKTVQDRNGSNPPTHSAVVFDYSGKTFRNEIYSEYKANRPPPPEDLIPQFPLTREATRAFSFPCLEMENFEADDIIATLARQAIEAGGEVTIVSSDKDLMQLVGNGVTMFEPMKGKVIGRDEVRDKFGVGPERVIDVQALAGDSTDNVPGAPGIGIKTAAQLIGEYGSLDELLERAAEIRQPKRRQTLLENADKIRMSRKLVTLSRDVPVDVKLEDLEITDPDPEELCKFLMHQEFRSIVRRVAEHYSIEAPSRQPVTVESSEEKSGDDEEDWPRIPFDRDSYVRIGEAGDLDSWIAAAYDRGHVAVDTETDDLDEMRASLVGISLSIVPGSACYIPLAHTTGETNLLQEEQRAPGQMEMDLALAKLKPLLEDGAILKIGQNIKYDVKIFARYGIDVAPVDDTMLMSFAMHSGLHRHSMDELALRYLEHETMPIKDLIGSGKSQITFDKTPIPDAVKYAAEDADVTLRLWERFRSGLHSARVTTVYETLERPLVRVLAEMEMAGIKVDRDHLDSLSQKFAGRMASLEKEIHEEAGEVFNVGSPVQLGEILFGRLKLPGGTRNKSGYATGARILEDLVAEGHRLPALVLDYRQMSKLKSTYTDSLSKRINPDTGRVHTSYVISGANTGRLASTDPNLQNIPVRTEEGRSIREAFVAEDGHVLLSLDYSQIELRILAHVAGIDSLKEAFRAGQDIHAMTASEMFGVPVEGMDPMVRRKAKAINFGVIYGISGFGLARGLKIPRAEAQEFINAYFARFPGIRRYMDDIKAAAGRDGFVRTLFGRKIHTPEIQAKGPKKAFAERAAINAPIQGAAADVIRRAMIRIPDAIRGMPARMLVQVHDELLFEVREDAVEDVTTAVARVMESADRPAVQVDPSLVVDSGFAENWAEAH